MRNDLDTRYSEEAERVVDIACFLDPRFKGDFAEDLDSTINACVEEALKYHTSVGDGNRRPQATVSASTSSNTTSTTSSGPLRTPKPGTPVTITVTKLHNLIINLTNPFAIVLSIMIIVEITCN